MRSKSASRAGRTVGGPNFGESGTWLTSKSLRKWVEVCGRKWKPPFAGGAFKRKNRILLRLRVAAYETHAGLSESPGFSERPGNGVSQVNMYEKVCMAKGKMQDSRPILNGISVTLSFSLTAIPNNTLFVFWCQHVYFL
jgi:hypothetical protein